jgi:hypothetical protein
MFIVEPADKRVFILLENYLQDTICIEEKIMVLGIEDVLLSVALIPLGLDLRHDEMLALFE